MDTKTLTTFDDLRKQLVNEYNTKKAELLEMEKNLTARNIIQSSTTPAPLVPSEEIKSELSKKILKAVGNGKTTQAEIEKANGKKKLYGKLQAMVKEGLLKKQQSDKGMVYVLPQ